MAAGLGLGMNVLDGTVVNVALPSIQRDLHSSFPTVQWVVNAYFLSFAILLATGGRLGDIFGRRRIFLIGVAVFAAASAGCGVAPNNATLLVARAIQGAGAALMIPATLALIVTNFPPELIPRAIGLWTGVTGVALAIGPVVGGVLTKAVSWRAIFYLNIPIALIAFVIALVAARESRDERASRRIDYPGIVTVSLGLTAAVLAVIEASSWGWGSARIIGLLAGSVVALALFVAIERRSDAPIVPLRGLPQPAVCRHQHRRLRAHVLGARGAAVHGDLHAGGSRLQRVEGRPDVPARDRADRLARSRVGPPVRALRGMRRWSRSGWSSWQRRAVPRRG